MHRNGMSSKERALRSRLAQLIHSAPLIRATLNEREVTCGKKGCRCAQGEKHAALYAVSSREGETRQTFIAQERQGSVRQWVANYHRVRELLEDLSELFWEQLRTKSR
jgi:hypothetical protein